MGTLIVKRLKHTKKHHYKNTANLKTFYAKDVWKTFTKFTGKHLIWNPCLVSKEDTITDVFL